MRKTPVANTSLSRAQDLFVHKVVSVDLFQFCALRLSMGGEEKNHFRAACMAGFRVVGILRRTLHSEPISSSPWQRSAPKYIVWDAKVAAVRFMGCRSGCGGGSTGPALVQVPVRHWSKYRYSTGATRPVLPPFCENTPPPSPRLSCRNPSRPSPLSLAFTPPALTLLPAGANPTLKRSISPRCPVPLPAASTDRAPAHTPPRHTSPAGGVLLVLPTHLPGRTSPDRAPAHAPPPSHPRAPARRSDQPGIVAEWRTSWKSWTR
eukprot:361213-Chlamydomonas_euryale.AAC.1